MQLFGFSILYLFPLFAVLVFEHGFGLFDRYRICEGMAMTPDFRSSAVRPPCRRAIEACAISPSASASPCSRSLFYAITIVKIGPGILLPNRRAMTAAPHNRTRADRRATASSPLAPAAVAVAMVGAAYAAVPLYFAVLPRDRLRRHDAGRAASRPLARRAHARASASTPMSRPGSTGRFEPETTSIALRTGPTATVFFRVHNRSDRETAAHRRLQRHAGVVRRLVRQGVVLLLHASSISARTRARNCRSCSSSIRKLEQDQHDGPGRRDHPVLYVVRARPTPPSRSRWRRSRAARRRLMRHARPDGARSDT